MAGSTSTKKVKTVTVEDKFGNEHEVPVGVDGKTPVSAQNPPAKALASDEDRDAVKDYLASEAPPAEDAKKS